jgi:hypothetical protein
MPAKRGTKRSLWPGTLRLGAGREGNRGLGLHQHRSDRKQRGGGVEVATSRARVVRAYRTGPRCFTSPLRRSSMAWHSSQRPSAARLTREGMIEPVVRASQPIGPNGSRTLIEYR